MKFGIREICDVMLKAKSEVKVGNKTFAKGAPVIYFDSLKTSSMEGAATTVYAQGGKGNARLVAWEGERTVTFTMEDALISEMGLSVLTGAGLIEASADAKIYVHTTERAKFDKDAKEAAGTGTALTDNADMPIYAIVLDDNDDVLATVKVNALTVGETELKDVKDITKVRAVMFDYYVEKTSGAKQIEIAADSFGGTYYLEAATLFRDQDGKDHAAEFVIPKCKIQSNFTFTMAATGDPSTFTFTMDAFPDYTKYDPEKKVFCAIQLMD